MQTHCFRQTHDAKIICFNKSYPLKIGLKCESVKGGVKVVISGGEGSGFESPGWPGPVCVAFTG